MNVHAHASVVPFFWEQEPRCLELLMMSPAKLVSSRKCLGPNVFCVWGMCFKHGQQVRSALWKWCSLIVVDWHKSTTFYLLFFRSLRNKEPFQNYWVSTPHPSPNKSKLKNKIRPRSVCTDGTLFHCRTPMPKFIFNFDWLGKGLGNPMGPLFKWFFISQWPDPETEQKTYFLRPEGISNVYV